MVTEIKAKLLHSWKYGEFRGPVQICTESINLARIAEHVESF